MSRAGEVTAVVLAHNEARHLPGCLETLEWSDETVILDSFSTDDTVDIARARGARTESHAFENFSRQRAHALGIVHTPWVLFVDADERVPVALAREIRAVLADPWARGYWIPRENWFWGRRVRGGGWWPDHQLRLLSVAHASYDPIRAVHELADVDGPTDRLTTPLVHLNYDDFAEFRAKQREYARLEARRRAVAGERPRPHNYLLQPAREFRRRYVQLGGWHDGTLGLILCLSMAWYELATLRYAARLARCAGR